MTETTCSARVQKLTTEIAALTSRRAELSDELSGAAPQVPDQDDLVEFREELLAALEGGNHAQRKALLQTLVAEIRVKDRSWIQPVFRVPIFRPPLELVHPTGQYSKKYPQVEGHVLRLSGRHAKLRREGYRKREHR